MESIASKAWAGFFTDTQTAIQAIITHYSLTVAVKSPPLREGLIADNGLATAAWAGYFQSLRQSLDACFVAASLTTLTPAPQFLSPMLYPVIADPKKFNPLAMRMVWVGFFTAVYGAILTLDAAATVPVTASAPPFNAALLNQ